MKRLMKYFTFRIHCIQKATERSAYSNNSTEFTYHKHLFDTEHQLDTFCKKNYIKRVYSPVSSPWYNGVLESTHELYQKEFYDFCIQELTLEKTNLKLRKYNNIIIVFN